MGPVQVVPLSIPQEHRHHSSSLTHFIFYGLIQLQIFFSPSEELGNEILRLGAESLQSAEISLSFSFSLSVCLSHSISLSVCLSVCLSLSLSVSFSLSLFVC